MIDVTKKAVTICDRMYFELIAKEMVFLKYEKNFL